MKTKIIIFTIYIMILCIYINFKDNVHFLWIQRLLFFYVTGAVVYHFVLAFQNQHRRLKEAKKNKNEVFDKD